MALGFSGAIPHPEQDQRRYQGGWRVSACASPKRRSREGGQGAPMFFQSGDFVPRPLTRLLARLASTEVRLGKSRLVSRGALR